MWCVKNQWINSGLYLQISYTTYLSNISLQTSSITSRCLLHLQHPWAFGPSRYKRGPTDIGHQLWSHRSSSQRATIPHRKNPCPPPLPTLPSKRNAPCTRWNRPKQKSWTSNVHDHPYPLDPTHRRDTRVDLVCVECDINETFKWKEPVCLPYANKNRFHRFKGM